MNAVADFAKALTTKLTTSSEDILAGSDDTSIMTCLGDRCVELNIHPIEMAPARLLCSSIVMAPKCADDLFVTYNELRALVWLEEREQMFMHDVDSYAFQFLASFIGGPTLFTDKQAQQIWNFVKELDPYCAIRSLESFYTNPEIVAIFDVAEEQRWEVLFDHLAVRCGTSSEKDSLAVSNAIKQHHGYVAAPVAKEQHYKFIDGWSAYPLYKVLSNGQVMRIFVDQSDEGFPTQIIQHWNKVYGFTSHHIALRCTRFVDGLREAVPLADLTAELNKKGVDTLPPTGEITHGLLEQLFTKPQVNDVPDELTAPLAAIDPKLVQQIRNGKLIELVSRKEMNAMDTLRLMMVYGINFNHQSSPIYPYFLPDQAMHVIRTSIQTNDA